jgi:hypothetical protein
MRTLGFKNIGKKMLHNSPKARIDNKENDKCQYDNPANTNNHF